MKKFVFLSAGFSLSNLYTDEDVDWLNFLCSSCYQTLSDPGVTIIFLFYLYFYFPLLICKDLMVSMTLESYILGNTIDTASADL